MPNFPIDAVIPRTEIIASAAQTEFVYLFPIFDEDDLKVYLRPADVDPDDSTQLLTLGTDYSVTGVDTEEGGYITLVTPASEDDIIIIQRDTTVQRTSDYNPGSPITAADLNRDLDYIIMMLQEARMYTDTRMLRYQDTEEITALLNLLPKLKAQEFLRANNDGTALIGVTLEESEGWSALRSELANESDGSDGARLVGYHDAVDGPMTVKEKLDNLQEEINDINTEIGDINTEITTIQTQIQSHVFRAHQTVAVTVPSGGTYVKVTFTTEDFDESDFYDISTSRFQPLVAGIYNIKASVGITGVDDNHTISLEIRKNGDTTPVTFEIEGARTEGSSDVISIQDNIQMNGTTDYLEIFVNQGDVIARDTIALSSNTFITGYKIQ
jgi:hypothetical protein